MDVSFSVDARGWDATFIAKVVPACGSGAFRRLSAPRIDPSGRNGPFPAGKLFTAHSVTNLTICTVIRRDSTYPMPLHKAKPVTDRTMSG
jgi:hypothetical protein